MLIKEILLCIFFWFSDSSFLHIKGIPLPNLLSFFPSKIKISEDKVIATQVNQYWFGNINNWVIPTIPINDVIHLAIFSVSYFFHIYRTCFLKKGYSFVKIICLVFYLKNLICWVIALLQQPNLMQYPCLGAIDILVFAGCRLLSQNNFFY